MLESGIRLVYNMPLIILSLIKSFYLHFKALVATLSIQASGKG